MPSNTRLVSFTTVPIQLFGYSKARTAWTIYNNSTNVVYWANVRGNINSMFAIPAGGSVGLKIPEDDPMKEVWVVGSGAVTCYVYEGFGVN